jgi:hypothetical protein
MRVAVLTMVGYWSSRRMLAKSAREASVEAVGRAPNHPGHST